MDISNIRSQFRDSDFIPLSSAQGARHAQSGENDVFAEMLKRAQKAQASSAQADLTKAGTVSARASSDTFSPAPVKHSAKPSIDKNDKLYELCMELETFLIKNLIKSMRSTVQKSELIDPGFAGGIYEDMLYDEYAKEYARNANFGFAEMAYRELSGSGR